MRHLETRIADLDERVSALEDDAGDPTGDTLAALGNLADRVEAIEDHLFADTEPPDDDYPDDDYPDPPIGTNDEEPDRNRPEGVVNEVGGSWWEVSLPGGAVEKVQGREAAEARAVEAWA